jgi:hypothetical protein
MRSISCADVDHARVQRLAPREGEQLRGQFRAALDRVEDAAQALFGCCCRLQHQLHVGADDVQDVVEVVRHAAGQLADRFQLLRARQRGARFVQALLALLFARLGFARGGCRARRRWRRSPTSAGRAARRSPPAPAGRRGGAP